MLDIEITKLIEVTGGQLVAGDIEKYGSERISGITYDSRTTGRGLLFVPIVGEKVDAHRFIADVLAGEAIISLTERSDIKYSGDKILVKVNSSVDAVRLITEYYRKSIRVPVIGVTGSVGKTTTREMISLAQVNNGVVLGLKTGTTKVSAKTTDGTNLTATCIINVTNPVKSVTLSKYLVELETEESETIIASCTPSNAHDISINWN